MTELPSDLPAEEPTRAERRSIVSSTIGESIASDGYVCRFRRWLPAGTPRGTLVALHGIQSHSGWYEFSSRRLSECGWEVRFLDRRGSGMNVDARGHARHAERLVNDVVQALEAARRESGDARRPVFLLGLSWGGRLATCVAGRRPDLIDGLVLPYPAIRSRFHPTWKQRFLMKLARAFDVTDRVAPIPLDDPKLFTSDPNWRQFLRDDPVALHQATSGFFLSSAALEAEAQRAAGRLSMPLLVLLAERDEIIDNAGVRRWLRGVSSRDVTVKEFAEAAHTLEFEACRKEFVATLLRWLEKVTDSRQET